MYFRRNVIALHSSSYPHTISIEYRREAEVVGRLPSDDQNSSHISQDLDRLILLSAPKFSRLVERSIPDVCGRAPLVRKLASNRA